MVRTAAASDNDASLAGQAAALARLQALIDASPAAIIELDRTGTVREWNPAAERLLGWSASEVLGRPLPPIAATGSLDLSRLLARLEHAESLSSDAQIRCRRKNGRMVDVEMAAAATRDTQGQVHGVMGLLVDVTERNRLERALQHRTLHDALTGLPNRTHLADRLAQTLAEASGTGRRTGVLLIDLDRFKEVNDTLGHAYGDQLLVQIGPRLLSGVLRSADTVARLAGDEFAVLLPQLDTVEDAVAAANRVLAALHAPFAVDGMTLDVAASIGVAVSPDHGTDPALLLRHADVAMYEAKDTAAGVVLYQPHRDVHTPTRLTLLGELRRALDGDELVCHYQPKVDLATGALRGVEALVRWQHPERGLLGPVEFVPVAETTGLISRLTLRVLDLVLAQARAWAEAGTAVPVAVNLSARCLHDRALPDRVIAALTRHGVPANLLRLEITESAIMSDPRRALEILRALATAGIGLSLDDFGTGYSSMSYLRQLPVDELKVDRSFVLDMAGEEPDSVLVRSAVDLGHNLGLTVVAEGVEDGTTLAALHALGCDTAQGYHLARPMPADRLTAWLRRHDHPMS